MVGNLSVEQNRHPEVGIAHACEYAVMQRFAAIRDGMYAANVILMMRVGQTFYAEIELCQDSTASPEIRGLWPASRVYGACA